MTPQTPPENGKQRSGNPAAQQTIKQQRAQQREAKVAAFKKEQQRKTRNKRIGIGAAIVGGVAVVSLVVVGVVASIPHNATYTAGSQDIAIKGVETFTNTNNHTLDKVAYEQSPPAGGDHNPQWLNCGVYSEPQVDENAVHSLEHGAVWVTYNPDISDAELDAIKEQLPSTYALLSPYPGMDNPITLSAWDAQLKIDKADDPRFAEFFEAYWKSEKVPEPGAPCTGQLDGPGKVR